MKRTIVSLLSANMFAFLIAGLSFMAYSRMLVPSELGLYAIALSVTSFLTLVLDGGLKNTIIKLDRDLTHDESTAVVVTMTGFAALLIVSLLVFHPALNGKPTAQQDMRFLLSFSSIALFFYPLVTLPTTRMERRLQYVHLAWIESAGILLERALPALFLITTRWGMYSFVVALSMSRISRLVALMCFHPVNIGPVSGRMFRVTAHLFREGGWIQLGSLSSVARDNLHTLLVGPFFGKEWIGYYAWALQICLISSQVFAQISSRVALPVLAQAGNFAERWRRSLYQIRLLTIFTTPMLCAVWVALPVTNDWLFHGKWTPALALIPLMFLRMVPGLATTPLEPLLMTEKGGYVFARANLFWTAVEVVGAMAALYLIGPTGLAWSYAIVVFIGIWILIKALSGPTNVLLSDIRREITQRPSLIVALALAVAYSLASHGRHPQATAVYVFAVCLVITSYLSEQEFRHLLVTLTSSLKIRIREQLS